MLEKITPIIRVVCIILLGLIAMQASRVALKKDPLSGINLAKLSPKTNAINAGGGTNLTAQANTNNPAKTDPKGGANAPSTNAPSTNLVQSGTNKISTNLVQSGTNIVSANVIVGATNALATNVVKGATSVPPQMVVGAPPQMMAGGPPNMMPGGPPGMMPGGPMMPPNMMPGGPRGRPGMPGGPGGAANLPPEIKARVEKIQQSEILGQIVRPMPMALMGIAGKQIFIRTASGQAGMASEGEDFGGVKIVKVGTNRVLVEEAGQQKELMLFEGFGGETLISKGKENQQ